MNLKKNLMLRGRFPFVRVIQNHCLQPYKTAEYDYRTYRVRDFVQCVTGSAIYVQVYEIHKPISEGNSFLF